MAHAIHGTIVRAAAALVLILGPAGPPPAGASQAATPACGASAQPADLTLSLTDMQGAQIRLSDHRGQVLVMHFWATWCATCKLEMQALDALMKTYGARGLKVLAVSVDDTPEKMRAFARDTKTRLPLLVGLDRDDVKRAYGPIFGVPTTTIVSRDGRICRKLRGVSSKERLERAVTDLL